MSRLTWLRPRTASGWLLAGLLALAGCRDPGAEAWARARQQHEALILAGVNPSNPRFDELLLLLDQVPPASKRYPEAQRLKGAIAGARAHLRRPLAVAHDSAGDLPSQMAAQAQACARLAEQLGRDGGVGAAGLKALSDCQRRVEELDSRCHSEHDGGLPP